MSGKTVKIIDGGSPIDWFRNRVGQKAKVVEEYRRNNFYIVKFADGKIGGLPIRVTEDVLAPKRRKINSKRKRRQLVGGRR